jgi:hypothetical protein
MRLSIAPVLVVFGLLLLSAKAIALPAEIILLRHAEKPNDPNDVHLTQVGGQRAEMLAGYLTSTPPLTNAGLPSVLIATAWTRHNRSRRPFETLEPVAKRLNLNIQQPFLAEDYAKLAHYVLTSPECDKKVVVICWVHDNLAELAKAIGIRPKPPEWKGSVYDQVWKITWPKKNRARLDELHQPPLGLEKED